MLFAFKFILHISCFPPFLQVFSVYLVTLGLIWLIFLYCDIRRHQGGNVIRLEHHHHHQLQHPRGSSVSNNTTSDSSRSSRGHNNSSRENIRHHHHHHNQRHHQQETRHHQDHIKYWKEDNNGGVVGGVKCHRKEFHRGKQTQRSDSVKLEDGISHLSVSVTPSNEPCRIYSSDSYTFCRSRHSGSFYLKIGAAGKCLYIIWKHINKVVECERKSKRGKIISHKYILCWIKIKIYIYVVLGYTGDV